MAQAGTVNTHIETTAPDSSPAVDLACVGFGITQQCPAAATLHGSGGVWIAIAWPGGSGCGLSAEAVGAPTAAMHTTAVLSIASMRLVWASARYSEIIFALLRDDSLPAGSGDRLESGICLASPVAALFVFLAQATLLA
jgi:hypothetical protein